MYGRASRKMSTSSYRGRVIPPMPCKALSSFGRGENVNLFGWGWLFDLRFGLESFCVEHRPEGPRPPSRPSRRNLEELCAIGVQSVNGILHFA